jgi:hypothetical protein
LKIDLSAEEANVLVNMLDVAVKAAGLQAAEAGLHFKRKIEEAAKAAQADSAPETEKGKS